MRSCKGVISHCLKTHKGWRAIGDLSVRARDQSYHGDIEKYSRLFLHELSSQEAVLNVIIRSANELLAQVLAGRVCKVDIFMRSME